MSKAADLELTDQPVAAVDLVASSEEESPSADLLTDPPDDTVTLNDRVFTIAEPDVDIVLRLLNIIGTLGVKGERIASFQVTGEVTARAAIFGMLAGMNLNDLTKFGSAVLQFEDERDGQRWLKEHGLVVAPLIKAFFINWRLSEDLQTALANFYEGVASLTATLDILKESVEAGGDD